MNNPVIRALSKSVADKIAAGEVVERPLSIVKELLENSIDAGATSVTIEIQKGGKEYIRVSDNGCGIEKEQLNLAFTRYATSKIISEDDLNEIGTLGFRGEALASIASVSKVELLTKTEDSTVGAKINLIAGEVTNISDTACEKGTTIIIRDLFFNTPARLKFLKRDNTEAALITDYVSKMSLAYPDVKIRLISSGTILFSTPGKNDLYQTILTVFSPQIARKLIPVAFEDLNQGLRIKGYISQPTESKTNRKWQIFFVNGRLVKNKLLENALSDAYHDKMFEGHYPLAFLFLQTDPKNLDVNIHPHKTEIRIYNEDAVSEFVIKSLRKALLNPDALNYCETNKAVLSQDKTSSSKKITTVITDPIIIDKPSAEEAPKATEPTAAIKLEEFIPVTKIEPVVISREKTNIFKDLRYQIEEKDTAVQEEFKEFESFDEKSREFYFSKLVLVGKAFDTYLICKDGDNIYFIDQHAAHERVMYETFLSAFNNEQTARQAVLTSALIELKKSDMIVLSDLSNILDKLGFTIEEFGESSILIKEIPAFMDLAEAEDFVKEFFEGASELKNNIQLKKDQIISRSCKAAVKAHDSLSDTEIKRLFDDLDKCENPFSCPHGRPVFVRFSNYEIERMFKRK